MERKILIVLILLFLISGCTVQISEKNPPASLDNSEKIIIYKADNGNQLDENLLCSNSKYSTEFKGTKENRRIGLTKESYYTLSVELNRKGNEALIGLADLTCLEELEIMEEVGEVGDPYVTDITPIKNLINLKRFWLRASVSDLTPIKNLTKLELLDISPSKVSDLTPIENLTKLEQLWILNTKITDISVLENLPHLRLLDLKNTNVSDISVLKKLHELQYVFLLGSKVSMEDCEDLEQRVPDVNCEVLK